MSRVSQYSVSVQVGDRPLGVFDKFSGGKGTSNNTKYRPGAMGAEVSLGGQKSRDDFEVERLYRLERDHANAKWLDSKRGSAEVIAVKQPLDTDGNPYGTPIIYLGTLAEVELPDPDSESDDAGLIKLTVTASGELG